MLKVTTSKFLGFINNQTLRLDHHIDSMVRKISSESGIL